MKVTITKHTDVHAARRAIESTMPPGFKAKADLNQIYTWMHSPIRTQIFEIELDDIYSYVSVHFARHVTVVPFITSKRTDRGGTGKEDRYELLKCTIWANAEAIINMAHKRLCFQADTNTWLNMWQIKKAMEAVDPALAAHMIPMCGYRGGVCSEPKPCGNYKTRRFDPAEEMARIKLGDA